MNNSLSNDMYSVKTSIADLKDKLGSLGAEQVVLQQEMSKLTARVRESRFRLPKEEYQHITRRQRKIAERIGELGNLREPLKAELRRWYAIEDELRAKLAGQMSMSLPDKVSNAHPSLLVEVKQLRDFYLSFAEDNTRVSSMRLMASQFANELTKLLATSK